jgi:hypothetical protein
VRRACRGFSPCFATSFVVHSFERQLGVGAFSGRPGVSIVPLPPEGFGPDRPIASRRSGRAGVRSTSKAIPPPVASTRWASSPSGVSAPAVQAEIEDYRFSTDALLKPVPWHTNPPDCARAAADRGSSHEPGDWYAGHFALGVQPRDRTCRLLRLRCMQPARRRSTPWIAYPNRRRSATGGAAPSPCATHGSRWCAARPPAILASACSGRGGWHDRRADRARDARWAGSRSCV